MSTFRDVRDEIRAQATLSTWVQKHVPLKRKGGDFWGLCPFHGEKTPSFSVNDTKGFYHCFGCGEHGDVFDFLMKLQGWDFRHTLEYLADHLHIALPQSTPLPPSYKKQRQALEWADAWFQKQLTLPVSQKARDYLTSRGFPTTLWKTFGLGYAPPQLNELTTALKTQGFDQALLEDIGLLGRSTRGTLYERFRDRIIFPIHDAQGRLIAFGGRALTSEQTPKYINSPETTLFHKGHTLYGLHHAVKHKDGPLCVVEGYFDVIRLAQHGWQAVAPLGTAVTESHLHLLWKRDPEPLIIFDGDSAGEKACLRLIERALPLLEPSHSLKVTFLPLNMDPDDVLTRQGVEAFQGLVKASLPLVDVLWKKFFEEQNHSTPERWAGARKDLYALVKTIQHGDIRHRYLETYKKRFYEHQSLTFRAGGARKYKTLTPPSPPLSKEKAQEKQALVLLGVCLENPSLVLDVSETLVNLFANSPFHTMVSHLIDILSETPHATPKETQKCLQDHGHAHNVHAAREALNTHGTTFKKCYTDASETEKVDVWLEQARRLTSN